MVLTQIRNFQRVFFLVNCRSHWVVVVQTVLWWKETSPVVVEVGVCRLGREPGSLGLWRINGSSTLVLILVVVVIVVVAATEAVGGSWERPRSREEWNFIVLVDSLQRERGSCYWSSCRWSWEELLLLLMVNWRSVTRRA
jgi:hypothetical protein